jgi:hypothetical protein
MNVAEHEALEAFKGSVSSMIKADIEEAEGNTPPRPKIYHYTDVAGALGILKSGELWLTERAHLNDTLEIQYGLHIAHELFETAVQNTSAHIPTHVTSHLKEKLTSGLTKFGFWVFSASLDDNEDIGQWRSYADDGRGVRLGFSIDKFDMKELAKDNIPYALTLGAFLLIIVKVASGQVWPAI